MPAIDERKKALDYFYYAAKQYAVAQPYFDEGLSIALRYYEADVAQKMLGKNGQRNRRRLGWVSGAEVVGKGR